MNAFRALRRTREAGISFTAVAAGFGLAAFVLGAVVMFNAHSGGTGALAIHVTPTAVLDFPPANQTCADFQPLGVSWTELKVPEDDSGQNAPFNGEFTDGTLTVTIANFDGKTFEWLANRGVDAVFVKAGRDGSNLYRYIPPETADQGLTSPGDSGNQISHISFCYDPTPPTATPTNTPVPTDTPEPTPTDTATPVPTDTPEPTPTDTPEPTPTDTPEPTPTDTATNTPTPTSTATATPTDTPEPTPTGTFEPTPTDTATATPTPTDTPAPEPTDTPEPTPTTPVGTVIVATSTPEPEPTPTFVDTVLPIEATPRVATPVTGVIQPPVTGSGPASGGGVNLAVVAVLALLAPLAAGGALALRRR
jgi:hypothetical protein